MWLCVCVCVCAAKAETEAGAVLIREKRDGDKKDSYPSREVAARLYREGRDPS